MIGHQIRTGGAIHSDCQQVVIGDGSVQRIDGLAAEHGAVALDGDGSNHRNRQTQFAAKLLHGQQSGFQASGIETGFDQQEIDAAFDQRLGLVVVILPQFLKGDGLCDIQVFGGGADGTGDESRLGGGGKFVGAFAGEFRGGVVQLVGPVLQLKFRQHNRGSAKSVGLDNVGAGLQISAMNVTDHIGSRDDQDFRTVLTPQKISFDIQRRLVDHGAHGAVEN